MCKWCVLQCENYTPIEVESMAKRICPGESQSKPSTIYCYHFIYHWFIDHWHLLHDILKVKSSVFGSAITLGTYAIISYHDLLLIFYYNFSNVHFLLLATSSNSSYTSSYFHCFFFFSTFPIFAKFFRAAFLIKLPRNVSFFLFISKSSFLFLTGWAITSALDILFDCRLLNNPLNN